MTTDSAASPWRSVAFPLIVVLATAIPLYATIVPRMVLEWWTDPNLSHGFLIPVFSAYLVWEKRSLLRIPADGRHAGPGIVLVLLAMAMVVFGKAGGEYFTMRVSLVFLVAGIVAILFGPRGLKECSFPVAFLAFMVPIPYIVYDTIAFPLKMAASLVGEHSLLAFGVPVYRDGNIISLPNLQLEVADACSGIRSLVSLVALATVVAYFLGLRRVPAALLLAAAVPVSLATNSLRIFITGVLAYRFGPGAAAGFFHEFSGWAIFLLGTVLLAVFGYCLRIATVRG